MVIRKKETESEACPKLGYFMLWSLFEPALLRIILTLMELAIFGRIYVYPLGTWNLLANTFALVQHLCACCLRILKLYGVLNSLVNTRNTTL